MDGEQCRHQDAGPKGCCARARCATLPPLACATSGNARWVLLPRPACATLPPLTCATSGTARWGRCARARSRDPPAAHLCHFGHRSLEVLRSGPLARPSRRSLVPRPTSGRCPAPLAGRSSAAAPPAAGPRPWRAGSRRSDGGRPPTGRKAGNRACRTRWPRDAIRGTVHPSAPK